MSSLKVIIAVGIGAAAGAAVAMAYTPHTGEKMRKKVKHNANKLMGRGQAAVDHLGDQVQELSKHVNRAAVIESVQDAADWTKNKVAHAV